MPNRVELVASSEARRILDIERSTLVRWAQTGVLRPAQKLPGPNGAYLYRRSDVEALAKKLAEGAA